MDEQIEDEFGSAVAIERFHRYAITEEKVYFGLLATTGEHLKFQAQPVVLAAIGEELSEIVRASRYVRQFGSMEGFRPLNIREPLPIGGDGKLTPYSAVGMKVMRASGHIEALVTLLEDMSARGRLTPTRLPDQGDRHAYRLDFQPKPPASIPLIIGDAIHSLRSALDVLINDIARIHGVSGDRLDFPFARNEANLTKILREKIEPFSPELAQEIAALKPYPDGNPDLIGLHELDIIDKHRMVIPAFVSLFKRWDLPGQINRLLAEDGRPPINITMVTDGMDQTPFRDGQILLCEPGADPFDGYVNDDDTTFEAQFPGTGPFSSERVVVVLGRLLGLVHGICLDLTEKFPPPAPAT